MVLRVSHKQLVHIKSSIDFHGSQPNDGRKIDDELDEYMFS